MKFITYQNIALKLYSYFLKEKERKRPFISLSKPMKRTAHLLNITSKTLKRWIVNESTANNDVDAIRGRPMKIDSFDRDLIGRTIVKMMGENHGFSIGSAANVRGGRVEATVKISFC